MNESIYVLATCLSDEMPPDNLVVNLTYWNRENGEYVGFGGILESLSVDELAKNIVEGFRQNGDEDLLSEISFCSPLVMPNGERLFSKDKSGRPLTFKEFESLQEKLVAYSESSSNQD